MAPEKNNFPRIDSDNDEQLMAENVLPQDQENDTNDKHNLRFDSQADSYEIDVEGDDPDYDHPQPYDTEAPNGQDDNSMYDEANPYVGKEYASQDELEETDLEAMGMHTDHGESVLLNREDELLAQTPEDLREDLDEEGYPINDRPE